MSARHVEFWVPGKAATKGSWKIRGMRLVPDNPGAKPWEILVNLVALEHWGPNRMSTKPIGLWITIRIARPKSNKDLMPTCEGKGDVDKYARCVLDALQGVVYPKDGQVGIVTCGKLWDGERGPGAWIRVWEIPK